MSKELLVIFCWLTMNSLQMRTGTQVIATLSYFISCHDINGKLPTEQSIEPDVDVLDLGENSATGNEFGSRTPSTSADSGTNSAKRKAVFVPVH
eukprot:gene1633-1811_t